MLSAWTKLLHLCHVAIGERTGYNQVTTSFCFCNISRSPLDCNIISDVMFCFLVSLKKSVQSHVECVCCVSNNYVLVVSCLSAVCV